MADGGRSPIRRRNEGARGDGTGHPECCHVPTSANRFDRCRFVRNVPTSWSVARGRLTQRPAPAVGGGGTVRHAQVRFIQQAQDPPTRSLAFVDDAALLPPSGTLRRPTRCGCGRATRTARRQRRQPVSGETGRPVGAVPSWAGRVDRLLNVQRRARRSPKPALTAFAARRGSSPSTATTVAGASLRAQAPFVRAGDGVLALAALRFWPTPRSRGRPGTLSRLDDDRPRDTGRLEQAPRPQAACSRKRGRMARPAHLDRAGRRDPAAPASGHAAQSPGQSAGRGTLVIDRSSRRSQPVTLNVASRRPR